MWGVIGRVWFGVWLGCFAAAAAQLPPEIMADRYLVRVERLIAEKNHKGALEVMNKIVALKKEHNLTLPDEFHFKYAQISMSAGSIKAVIDSVNKYLAAAGRTGEFYLEALELLDSAEEKLRQAEAKRLRVEAKRRRAEAIQRENEELTRRQVEEASIPLRDRLGSGGLGPEMVKIWSGRLQFAISKYEVTRGEFEQFVKSTRYRTEAERKPKYGCARSTRGNENYGSARSKNSLRWNRPGFDQTDNHPVTCVSIRDAMAYAEWLSTETGHSYRLPSFAEWSYAANAGSSEPEDYRDSSICRRGNVEDTGKEFAAQCSDGVRYTAEVGQFTPNGVGLYDMVGNVSEIVMYCYFTSGGRGDITPENLNSCKDYVAVGSSWYDVDGFHTIRAKTYRELIRIKGVDDRYHYHRNRATMAGFRVVRDFQD